MAHVILSLAANRHQKSNLARARQRLGELLSETVYTSECWTQPLHATRSDLYLNQLVSATTRLTLEQLSARLKQIELDMGRTPQKRQLGMVPIDLDVLLYDNQQLHQADWQRPYVQQLINELQ